MMQQFRDLDSIQARLREAKDVFDAMEELTRVSFLVKDCSMS